jgi:hypothetical protein
MHNANNAVCDGPRVTINSDFELTRPQKQKQTDHDDDGNKAGTYEGTNCLGSSKKKKYCKVIPVTGRHGP